MIKKIMIILLLLIFQLKLPHSLSEAQDIAMDTYRKLDQMTAKELKSKGDEALKNGIKDTALLYLTLFCNKYDPDNMSIQEKKDCADAYNQLGTLHYNYSNYKKAMTFFIKGLSICENIGYNFMTASIYNNIGNVYLAFKEYNKAIYYFKLSYTKSKANKYNHLIFLTLNNLVIANCYLGKIKSAQLYMNKIPDTGKEENTELKQSLFNSIGAVNMNIGAYDSAVYYFKKAFKEKSGSGKQNYVSLSNIGSAYKAMGYPDSAVYYLNLSNLMSEKYDIPNLLSLNYKQLSQIYEKKGNYKKALDYDRKYQTIKDSIFDNHEYGEVKDKLFVYEMDKINKKLELLNVEKEIQRLKINGQHRILIIVSISLFLILILLVIVYIQKYKLGKSYKNLFIKNVDIINSEKYYRELRIDYERKVKSMENEISKLTITDNHISDITSTQFAENENDTNSNYSKTLDEYKKETLIQHIQSIMDNSLVYCETNFTLETLAELVNSNTKYVSLVINSEFGKNFNIYINEYRIKEACRLLISPESKLYTIETIASMVGFKSKSSFNPIFKKITGLTPSQYQKISIDSYKK